MKLPTMLLAGAAILSTPALAQTTAPTVQPDTPAKAKTTTTQTQSTTAPVATPNGGVAVQKTTDTTQTTTTQPASGGPAQSATTQSSSTSTTAPDATGAATTTTTTTTTEPAADATGATVTAATAADIKKGAPVYDQKGGVVGKVESVSAKGAVVSTGKARAEIPMESFGKNDKGLVMSMTKVELEAAAKKK